MKDAKMLLSAPWQPVFAQIDLKKCLIKLKDGSAVPKTLEIKIGEGNLSWTEKVNRQYVKNRGALDLVRNGDEEPMDIKLDATYEYIKGTASTDGLPSIEDALKNRNGAVAWVSSDNDACNPFALDLEVIYSPTPTACGDEEIALFPDFRYEQLDHDIKAGTISITGKCNAKMPTITRHANS